MGNIQFAAEEALLRATRAMSGPGGSQCPRCPDRATMVCQDCKSIAYCSEECLTADLASHKVLCEM